MLGLRVQFSDRHMHTYMHTHTHLPSAKRMRVLIVQEISHRNAKIEAEALIEKLGTVMQLRQCPELVV